ncbi:hypothetical protein [Bacillus testis]|uniref:hypothetical protein n=1 Tax=Bacillus testis TaxID=1622072 RepID=UPI00067E9730|nr:hypothetical protein [Bacillus testis]
MTRIPAEDRDKIEQAIYLPMVLIILQRDLSIFEKGPFKLRNPYIEWVEQTIVYVQHELRDVKHFLRQQNIRVNEMKRDDAFTMYAFFYKGYEEHHNYFNPRIRNKVEELLKHYLFGRLQ